jgi:hypothetical protein
MTNRHPITPPIELVRQWIIEEDDPYEPNWQAYEEGIANRAAQWGADQELEACCEWLQHDYPNIGANALRTARRPKPQTLNSIALEMLGTIEKLNVVIPEITDTIRRALEQLDDN